MTRQWTVTEATEQAAFLSDAEGYDVAVLRVLPDELFETGRPLTGDEWQSMVDLVAAAPAMLSCLREYVFESRKLGWGCSSLDTLATAVIAKAEGKDRIPHEQ